MLLFWWIAIGAFDSVNIDQRVAERLATRSGVQNREPAPMRIDRCGAPPVGPGKPFGPLKVLFLKEGVHLRQSVLERAFELANSGRFRLPSEVRAVLAAEGYPTSEVFLLEKGATWSRLRTVCGDARYGQPGEALSG